ncbi:MAG: formimidoylglutamase [Chitinophagales bacterium]
MFEEFLRLPDYDIYEHPFNDSQFGNQLIAPLMLPDSMEGIQVAIIGVREDRGSKHNVGSAQAPDEIRRQLLALTKFNTEIKFGDLGNIDPGASLQDSYVALSKIVNELLHLKILPVIIGGSHDLTFSQYSAYQDLKHNISMSVVDSMIDFHDGEDGINDENFLGRIFVMEPSCLFQANIIAHQAHLTTPQAMDVMEKLHFESYRLGKVRSDIYEMEPVLRGSHLLSIDLSSVRFADSPANYTASPNGLFGEEACQLARYAGQSDTTDSFGLYGCNLAYDNRDQSVKLAAQIIWYFLDGFCNRHQDFPKEHDENYLKYTVQFKENKYEMSFWKSKKSDRWWMEVPVSRSKRNQKKFHIIPCSYHDYQLACAEEVPERWMKTYAKLS